MNQPIVDLKSCSNCPIRHRAVCAKCDTDELKQLEEIKYYRSYQAGQPLVWAGDQMDFVASVVTGIATLSQTMEDGRTQMVGLLLPSDFLGRPGRAIAPYDVTANSDLTLCCFRRKPFEAMMEKTPRIGNRLLEMTLDELDAARQWMLILGRKTAREKIASFLLMLAKRAKQRGLADNPVSVPMSRTDIGDYLGLTTETVSRTFTQLKQEGIIQLLPNHQVDLADKEALEEIAGGF